MQSRKPSFPLDESTNKQTPRQAPLTQLGGALPVPPTPEVQLPPGALLEKPLARPEGSLGKLLSLLFPYYSGFSHAKQVCQHMQKFSASFPGFRPSSPSSSTSSECWHRLERTLQAAASPQHPPLTRPGLRTHLQSLPRVLLSSALCRCGYWSASFLRAACAHTMNAFMGLFTWGLFLLDPFTRTGIGTKVQS